MRKAGFEENFADRFETMDSVKGHGVTLRMKKDSFHTELGSLGEQRGEQRAACAAPARFAQHGHTPDLAGRRQARCPDRISIITSRHNVPGLGVGLIPFKRRGHVLFANENRFANCAQLAFRLMPSNQAHV